MIENVGNEMKSSRSDKMRDAGQYVLKLTVNDHPGVMSHVCGLFARRCYNLEGVMVRSIRGECDKRSRTQCGNQHRLRHFIEDHQQNQYNNGRQTALQCVAPNIVRSQPIVETQSTDNLFHLTIYCVVGVIFHDSLLKYRRTTEFFIAHNQPPELSTLSP